LSIILKGDGPSVGERSNTVATMKMFADEFLTSKAGTGWQKLPSGLIIQWGFSAPTGSVSSISFPIAFPTACYSVSATIYGPSTPDTTVISAIIGPYSAAGFDVRRRYVINGTTGVAGEAITWFAVGA